MILLSVDPGTHTGCCLFQDGIPSACWTLRGVTAETVWQEFLIQRPLALIGRGTSTVDDHALTVVIEIPDTWTRKDWTGRSSTETAVNVDALLSLQAMVYVFYGHFQHMGLIVWMVPTSRWKGTKSKRQTANELRIIQKAEGWSKLATNEHERDALALGLWWWTRRKVEGVKP